MIPQTYCGQQWHDQETHRSDRQYCNPDYGPCPSCLREHIARLEARNAELEAGRPDLANLIRTRYPRLLERRNQLYDGVLAEAVEAQAATQAAPAPIEPLIHDLAMAAWDCGADAGDAWCRDADRSKRGIVPMTPEEGFADARRHFSEHGAGSLVAPFSIALEALRAGIAQAAAQAGGVVVPEQSAHSEFKRELRYLVLKWADIEEYGLESQKRELRALCASIELGRTEDRRRINSYVVVADDWPEYEPTWKAIEARMAGAALPASRVLGEGEQAVPVEELKQLEACFESIRGHWLKGDKVFGDQALAMQRLEGYRRNQPTEGGA